MDYYKNVDRRELQNNNEKILINYDKNNAGWTVPSGVMWGVSCDVIAKFTSKGQWNVKAMSDYLVPVYICIY